MPPKYGAERTNPGLVRATTVRTAAALGISAMTLTIPEFDNGSKTVDRELRGKKLKKGPGGLYTPQQRGCPAAEKELSAMQVLRVRLRKES